MLKIFSVTSVWPSILLEISFYEKHKNKHAHYVTVLNMLQKT